MLPSGYKLGHRQIGEAEPCSLAALTTRTDAPVRYSDIIKEHNAQNPYTDVDFPTTKESVGPIQMDSANYANTYPLWDKTYVWLRAADAVEKACGASSCKFVELELNEPGAAFSRDDIKQGCLGDCWFLACTSAIPYETQLINFICPNDNNRNNDSGAYHLRICYYGLWIDVVVDDYLVCAELFGPGGGWNIVGSIPPLNNGVAELWPVLLEKAYAKLNGSYGAIEANTSLVGFEDLTGGFSERIVMGSLDNAALFEKLMVIINLRAFVALSCLGPKGNLTKDDLDNAGIHYPHSYSVTNLLEVSYNDEDTPIIRVRNPWGNAEWNGAWSDSSDEWKSIDEATKSWAGLTVENDGEFWMSLADATKYFAAVEICYWNSDSDYDNLEAIPRIANFYNGWSVSSGSAGGFQNPASNPQYKVTVVDADGGDGMGLLYVTMQIKGPISQISVASHLVLLYKVADTAKDPPYNNEFFTEPTTVLFQPSGGTRTYGDAYFRFSTKRRITNGFKIVPGTYVIVPATKKAGVEEQFLIKIVTRNGDIKTA